MKELKILYLGLQFSTLRTIIYDLILQLESEKDSKKRDFIKKQISLPISIHIKYTETYRNSLCDTVAELGIETDTTYNGTH